MSLSAISSDTVEDFFRYLAKASSTRVETSVSLSTSYFNFSLVSVVPPGRYGSDPAGYLRKFLIASPKGVYNDKGMGRRWLTEGETIETKCVRYGNEVEF